MLLEIISVDNESFVKILMLLVAAGGLFFTVKWQYGKDMKNSVDRTDLDKMEKELECKATIEYVDKKMKSAHDRMDRNELRVEKKLDFIIAKMIPNKK